MSTKSTSQPDRETETGTTLSDSITEESFPHGLEPETEDHVLKRDLESDVMEEYERRRRRQTISGLPLIILIIGLLLTGFPDTGPIFGLSQDLVLPLVGVSILGFFGFSLVNWRCPSCNSYFGQRLNPKKCPNCEAILRN